MALLAYWNLDEGTGITAYDSEGSNDGTLISNATWLGAGLGITPKGGGVNSGDAIILNGSTDRVSVGNDISLTTMGARTVNFWAKLEAQDFGNFMMLENVNMDSRLCIIGSFPLLILGAANSRYFNDVSIYLDNNWHNWTWVITGVGDDDIDNSKLYIDGNLIDVYSTVKTGSVTDWGTHCIGGSYYSLVGSIDEVGIWNEVLSAEDALLLYYTPPDSHIYPTIPDLDQGYGAMVIDEVKWNLFIDNINAIADDLVAARADSQTFPGTPHTAEQSGNLLEILEAIKHELSDISGETNWYDDPLASLKIHSHAVGRGGLIPWEDLGADNDRCIEQHSPLSGMYTFKLRGGSPSGENTITLSYNQDIVSYVAHNYVNGVSAESDLQDVYIPVRFTLPLDFGVWATIDAIKIEYKTGSAVPTNSHVDVYIYKSGNADLIASSEDNASTTWGEILFDVSDLGSSWSANDIIQLYIKLESRNSNFARIGKLKLNYKA